MGVWGRRAGPRSGGLMPRSGNTAARLGYATVPANARDSKWSPLPPLAKTGATVRSPAFCGAGSADDAGGSTCNGPRPVGKRPCLRRAFSLMAWYFDR